MSNKIHVDQTNETVVNLDENIEIDLPDIKDLPTYDQCARK